MRYASTGPVASYWPALASLPEEQPISSADAQFGMRRRVLQTHQRTGRQTDQCSLAAMTIWARQSVMCPEVRVELPDRQQARLP